MKTLAQEVIEAGGGESIKACYQCGTCTGGCPTAGEMDYTPRQIIRMVNLGMRDRVLTSNSIWLCASCYQCQVRCPRGVRITDIMAALRSIAIRDGITPARPRAPAFYQSFLENISTYGRQFEPMLILKTVVRSREGIGEKLGFLLGMLPMGITLMRSRKMPLKAERVQGIEEVRRLFSNAEKLEAEG